MMAYRIVDIFTKLFIEPLSISYQTAEVGWPKLPIIMNLFLDRARSALKNGSINDFLEYVIKSITCHQISKMAYKSYL